MEMWLCAPTSRVGLYGYSKERVGFSGQYYSFLNAGPGWVLWFYFIFWWCLLPVLLLDILSREVCAVFETAFLPFSSVCISSQELVYGFCRWSGSLHTGLSRGFVPRWTKEAVRHTKDNSSLHICIRFHIFCLLISSSGNLSQIVS